MAKAWNGVLQAGKRVKPLDWRKRMSDNIAYALLVYTSLQIFVTMGMLESKGGSLLPYFALIILVAAIIPACRMFEKRWNRLNDEQAADPQYSSYYRRDQLWLWLLAIGLPFAVSGLFFGMARLAH
jgi:undecaprenyl pyrophosphate phosphatase UppP